MAQGGCSCSGARSSGTAARSRLYPSFPSVLFSLQLPPSPVLPPALSHPCFLLPLSILSSHLSLQCPPRKMLPQRCSHPQSKGEPGPCPPYSTALARRQPLRFGHPVPQSQPPTSRLSREEDETKTCQNHKATSRAQTRPAVPQPGGGHEARWAGAERSAGRAAQQRCAGMCHPQRDIPEASKCRFSHSRWQIPQRGGEAGCPPAPPAIALTQHLPFQGWEPAPGSQALPSTTLLIPAPDVPKDSPPRARDQPLPPARSPLHPGPSATAPGGSTELKQKRTLV